MGLMESVKNWSQPSVTPTPSASRTVILKAQALWFLYGRDQPGAGYLLNRDFSACAPNRKRLTDIT